MQARKSSAPRSLLKNENKETYCGIEKHEFTDHELYPPKRKIGIEHDNVIMLYY
jgi:hypothetical protein